MKESPERIAKNDDRILLNEMEENEIIARFVRSGDSFVIQLII
jgi:hypothetical protein